MSGCHGRGRVGAERGGAALSDFYPLTRFFKARCPDPATGKACPTLGELLRTLANRHAMKLQAGVARGLTAEGKVNDVLNPFEAFLKDLKDAVATAERCDLIGKSDAAVAIDAIQLMLDIVREMRKVLPEDAIVLALDMVQLLVGILGLIPAIGIVADIVDIAISGARQDWWGVGLGVLAAIPAIGIVGGVGVVLARKGPKVVKGLKALGGRAAGLARLLRKLLGSLGRFVPSRLKGSFDYLLRKLDDFIKKFDDAPSIAIGFARGTAHTALEGMRRGGGHAIAYLVGDVIPNTGSLASKVAAFRKIAVPILEGPLKSFNGWLGGTKTRIFIGIVDGRKLAIFVAAEGPYKGKVISSFFPNAKKLAEWGL